MTQNKKKKITLGGWYQRTTLHLSEIYDLFSRGESRLPLDKSRLKQIYKNLDLVSVERKSGYFDSVEAVTKEGIVIKYFR